MSSSYQYRRRYQNIETGEGLFFSLSNEEVKPANQKIEVPDEPISASTRGAQPIDRQKVSVDKSDLRVALFATIIMATSIFDQSGYFFLSALLVFLLYLVSRIYSLVSNGRRPDLRLKILPSMIKTFLISLFSDGDFKLAWSVMKVFSEK